MEARVLLQHTAVRQVRTARAQASEALGTGLLRWMIVAIMPFCICILIFLFIRLIHR